MHDRYVCLALVAKWRCRQDRYKTVVFDSIPYSSVRRLTCNSVTKVVQCSGWVNSFNYKRTTIFSRSAPSHGKRDDPFWEHHEPIRQTRNTLYKSSMEVRAAANEKEMKKKWNHWAAAE